jgi:cullin 3
VILVCSNAYNLVLHKHGDLLYDGVQETVEMRLRSVAEAVASSPDEQLLSQICEQWKEHQVTMVMVRDILMYMDRTYVPQNKKMAVYDVGLRAFRETITRHDHVRDRLRCVLLENVRIERAGRLIDQTGMRCALYMLADLGIESSSVYEEDFECFFLEETRSFYRNESRAFLAANTCPDYLKKVESRLNEEQDRVPNYLHASTRLKLEHIVESELISAHAASLINSRDGGFMSLLDMSEDRMSDLARMYALFSRVPQTLDLLRGALFEHVYDAGRRLVDTAVEMPVDFLEGLLLLRSKYDAVVTLAFRGETAAQKRLKEAFEQFLNADARCASCLVIYVDELMRRGFKGATERDVERQLDQVILIFRYLNDKDVFEAYYKQHLAKRLLHARSMPSDAERSMLAKLKSECGYQFTTKLEGMFTDIRFSKDAMDKYRAHSDARSGTPTAGDAMPPPPAQSGNSGQTCSATRTSPGSEVHAVVRPTILAVDLDVTTLTAGYWPMQATNTCRLPAAAQAVCEPFESFYLKQHTGRKLTWLTSTGSAEIRATFSQAAKHELTVSTYMMCILVLFNDLDHGAEITFAALAAQTQIPRNELKRHVVSLCTPKHRVLLKKSKGKGVSDDDAFKVNIKYSSKLKRVRVPLVAMKEAGAHPDSSDKVPAAVEEDRRHLCEATVVRIMKARKHAKHNDLIAEVTRQLSQRFFPQPQFIKKSIESLLEREYLERDASDSKMYIYMA